MRESSSARSRTSGANDRKGAKCNYHGDINYVEREGNGSGLYEGYIHRSMSLISQIWCPNPDRVRAALTPFPLFAVLGFAFDSLRIRMSGLQVHVIPCCYSLLILFF